MVRLPHLVPPHLKGQGGKPVFHPQQFGIVVPLCGGVVELGVVALGFGVVAGVVVLGVVALGFGVVAPGLGVVAPGFGVVALGLMVVVPVCGAALPDPGVHGLIPALVPALLVGAEPAVDADGDVLLTEPFAFVSVVLPEALGVVVVGGAPADAVVPGAALEAEAPTFVLGVQGAVVVGEGVVVFEGDAVAGVVVPDVALGVVVPLCVPVAGELLGSDVVPLFGNVPCGVPGDGVIVPLLGIVVVGVEVCGTLVPGGGCVPAPVACAAATAAASTGAAKKISVLRMFPPTCRFLSWMRRVMPRWCVGEVYRRALREFLSKLETRNLRSWGG